MIGIALPKGRLGESVYGKFDSAGLGNPDALSDSRKLMFESAQHDVRYYWVKPSDVAVYVERGVADIGVVGSDVLRETEPEIYELADLDVGKCRLCVIAQPDFADNGNGLLRVASNHPNCAKKHFASLGRDADIIKLNGSVELAPLLGLSDVIVDIVESGNTIKENGLIIQATIFEISARVIANKVSFKLKYDEIQKLAGIIAPGE